MTQILKKISDQLEGTMLVAEHRRIIEKLTAPVSDKEWNLGAYTGDPEYMLREDVDRLIASRATSRPR